MYIINKSMDVKLPDLLENYGRPIDRPTERRTDWAIGKFHFKQ